MDSRRESRHRADVERCRQRVGRQHEAPPQRIDHIFVGDPYGRVGGAGLVTSCEPTCHEQLRDVVRATSSASSRRSCTKRHPDRSRTYSRTGRGPGPALERHVRERSGARESAIVEWSPAGDLHCRMTPGFRLPKRDGADPAADRHGPRLPHAQCLAEGPNGSEDRHRDSLPPRTRTGSRYEQRTTPDRVRCRDGRRSELRSPYRRRAKLIGEEPTPELGP